MRTPYLSPPDMLETRHAVECVVANSSGLGSDVTRHVWALRTWLDTVPRGGSRALLVPGLLRAPLAVILSERAAILHAGAESVRGGGPPQQRRRAIQASAKRIAAFAEFCRSGALSLPEPEPAPCRHCGRLLKQKARGTDGNCSPMLRASCDRVVARKHREAGWAELATPEGRARALAGRDLRTGLHPEQYRSDAVSFSADAPPE